MNGRKVVACSGQRMDLECDAGSRIQLVSAFYGRHDGSNKCARTSYPSCDGAAGNDVLERVALGCNAFATCSIQVMH